MALVGLRGRKQTLENSAYEFLDITARVPQLVARHPVLRDATHALGEQTPLLVSSLAILSRQLGAHFR